MRVLLLNGSPSRRSRTQALLDHAAHWLTAHGIETVTYRVGDLPAEALLAGYGDAPALRALQADLERSAALLIASPVYKAAYAGGLKAVLDVLPERALADKVILPLATAGSAAHLLALDYALRPVLAALKGEEILQGVYADSGQILDDGRAYALDAPLQARLEQALERLRWALLRHDRPLPFSAGGALNRLAG